MANMREACPFPIIIDNFLKIIYVGHFECIRMIYNSQLFFSALNMANASYFVTQFKHTYVYRSQSCKIPYSLITREYPISRESVILELPLHNLYPRTRPRVTYSFSGS